jgi:hypothetical protein
LKISVFFKTGNLQFWTGFWAIVAAVWLPNGFCFAQNLDALAYFSLEYPTCPNEIESMRLVLQKNQVKNLKSVYQFDNTDKNLLGVTMFQTQNFNADGELLSSMLLTQNAERDTLNRVENMYLYNKMGKKSGFEYRDLRGDEPNRSEQWLYDEAGKLRQHTNHNPLTKDSTIYRYDAEKRVKTTVFHSENIEFERQKYVVISYMKTADTLRMYESVTNTADSTAFVLRNAFVLRDTVLCAYDMRGKGTEPLLIGKYFFNKNKKILKYAVYDQQDAYLPLHTYIYVYYASGQLRAVQDYKGAGNLQKVTLYRPTGEILSVEYFKEKTKREYFYNAVTGLPLRTDMYKEGRKKGQINYVVF